MNGITRTAVDARGFRRKGTWGPWRLDAETLVIYSDPDSHVGYRYEIDLEDCQSSARVLDWICQISQKHWGTETENASCVAGLIAAFNDVLHPQASLCSWGTSKRLTKAQIRTRVSRYVGGAA